MTGPNIDVVVCTYDAERLRLLGACASAIGEQLTSRDRLIVVVDGPASLQRLVTAQITADRCVRTDGPYGLSVARNVGIRAGSNPVVAFIDDDAVPEAGWLEAIRAASATGVHIVAGAVTAAWPDSQRPPWFPRTFDWTVGCDYTGIAADQASVRNPIGANMAVARQIFDDVGGFDARLGRTPDALAGAEETELAVRAAAHDLANTPVRIASARVRHHIAPGRCRRRYVLGRAYQDGRSKAVFARLATTGRGSMAPEIRHAVWTIPRDCFGELISRPAGWGAALQYVAISLAATCGSAIGFVRGAFNTFGAGWDPK